MIRGAIPPGMSRERVIALVLEQLHVVAAHESRVPHALATACRFNHRLRHPRARRLTRMHSAADQQTKQQCRGAKSGSH